MSSLLSLDLSLYLWKHALTLNPTYINSIDETGLPTLESLHVKNLSHYIIFMHNCLYENNLSTTQLDHEQIHFPLKMFVKHVLIFIKYA